MEMFWIVWLTWTIITFSIVFAIIFYVLVLRVDAHRHRDNNRAYSEAFWRTFDNEQF